MEIDLKTLIEKYDIEELNKVFMEYFAVVIAKSMKYDELVDAINENGCNMAKIHKILESDVNDTYD